MNNEPATKPPDIVMGDTGLAGVDVSLGSQQDVDQDTELSEQAVHSDSSTFNQVKWPSGTNTNQLRFLCGWLGSIGGSAAQGFGCNERESSFGEFYNFW